MEPFLNRNNIFYPLGHDLCFTQIFEISIFNSLLKKLQDGVSMFLKENFKGFIPSMPLLTTTHELELLPELKGSWLE